MWKALFSSSEPEAEKMASEVTLSINGQTIKVASDVTAATTLNAYVRDTLQLKGTKYNCYEGTCGACIVVAKIEHPITKVKETFSINSCLVPILSCHGWEITTVEGVGNRKDNYHQVQTQLAQKNGTQCGFCTPGIVMNMFSLVADDKKPTMAEVENAFGSNICRCTGYRSILEAYKAMASDAPPEMKKQCADIEDLFKTCSKTGLPCSGECKKFPSEQIKVDLGAEMWYKVLTIEDLFKVFGEIGDEKYKLVAGNTAEGVYRSRDVTKFIDVKDIPDLRKVQTTPTFQLGANVTLTEAVKALKQQAATAGFAYLNEIADYWGNVASIPIRNIGTLAGNLALKKEKPAFASDIFTALASIGANINVLIAVGKTIQLTTTGFLNYDMNKKVILNIELPALDDSLYVFRTFHVLPRAQSIISHVNAAFLIKKTSATVWDLTEKPRIVFGGIGASFVHAVATENYLSGKNILDNGVATQAISTLNGEVRPEEVKPGASVDYRKKLAVGLFYKFLLGLDPEKVNPIFRSGAEVLTRELSTSEQDFDTNKSVYPLNEPIPKIEALPQCSGEIQYTDDIPKYPGELQAALVLTKKAPAEITGYDTQNASTVPGFVAFYSAADLAENTNSFTPPDVLGFLENEEIFCNGRSKYAGQSAGVVVAETKAAAMQAAALVVINYKETSSKPIISTKDAPRQREKKVFIMKDDLGGKIPKSAFVEKGTFEIGSQYPLYLENLSCIVVPTEDGYDVHSSTQWMDLDQIVVARTVGVPVNKVNVYVKRIGGGFGGKQSRSGILAAACALAAKKQNRPVRLILSLSANMEVTSKRFSQRNEYEVGYDSDGKIEYAVVDVFQDSGCSHNESPMPIFEAFFNSCYGTKGYKISGNEVLTDKASNGPIRGPGPIEGVAFHDEIMERIAKKLQKDPLEIKLLNMDRIDSPLPALITELQQKSDYATRRAAVETFNQENRWKKKGMAITPMRYPFYIWNNLNSTVAIYHGDGSVAIAHGGIEMGQGLNTKVSQVAAHILGLKVDQISIKPSSTTNGANCKMSGGSIISEGVSYATMKACQILLERLAPVKVTMDNPTWPQLIQEAYNRDVNLTAQFMFSKEVPDVKDYNIWAVCISEVEVDILTGEKQVLRVDLLEDVGQSLSPLIDIGQIEGAFVMGLGYWLSEELNYDPDTARLLENRLWHYAAPGAKDIPVDFRVYLRKNAPNPIGVLGSKSTGEPAICMSVNVWFAIRNALESARKDANGSQDYFTMKHPATNENIYGTTLTDLKQFSL